MIPIQLHRGHRGPRKPAEHPRWLLIFWVANQNPIRNQATMPSRPRIQYEGVRYHVINRDNYRSYLTRARNNEPWKNHQTATSGVRCYRVFGITIAFNKMNYILYVWYYIWPFVIIMNGIFSICLGSGVIKKFPKDPDMQKEWETKKGKSFNALGAIAIICSLLVLLLRAAWGTRKLKRSQTMEHTMNIQWGQVSLFVVDKLPIVKSETWSARSAFKPVKYFCSPRKHGEHGVRIRCFFLTEGNEDNKDVSFVQTINLSFAWNQPKNKRASVTSVVLCVLCVIGLNGRMGSEWPDMVRFLFS